MRQLNSAVISACVAGVLGAQSKPPGGNDDVTFQAFTRLVVLHASVADKSGKLITNLPREAFKVFENGQEQLIKELHREDVPVSLGILIDNSGSMTPRHHKLE